MLALLKFITYHMFVAVYSNDFKLGKTTVRKAVLRLYQLMVILMHLRKGSLMTLNGN